jgi:predicted RNase H-like HicB family nuclease
MTHKYEIILYWSDEDNVFIAEVPELPYSSAHGDTYEEALKEVQVVMDAWIEIAEDRGQPIPKPKGRRLMFA